MGGLLASAGSVIGYLVDAVKYGPIVINFIHSTVVALEATDKSGPDKLSALLNAVQVACDDAMPDDAAEIDALMKAVEALVTDIVTVYNDAGVFAKKIAPSL